jgi:hypothetical protein
MVSRRPTQTTQCTSAHCEYRDAAPRLPHAQSDSAEERTTGAKSHAFARPRAHAAAAAAVAAADTAVAAAAAAARFFTKVTLTTRLQCCMVCAC